MVLPPPAPHPPHAGDAWLRRITRPLGLTRGGVLVLLDDARAPALGPLVRALLELDPDTRVCLDAGSVARLPPDSTVLLRMAVEDAVWLNLHRPMFAERRLRCVLWCAPDLAPRLRDLAPDFFDWISHVVVCPDLVPGFVATGLRAAPPFPGVLWRGPLDPETALAAVFPGTSCRRSTWPRNYLDVVTTLRESPPGWIVWDGLPNTRALHRLRLALRETDRDDLRCLVVEPPATNVGFWPIDTRPDDWGTATTTLEDAGWDLDAPKLAALADLEPGLVDTLVALRPRPTAPELEALLRASDDPGAALARLSPETFSLADLGTRRAPSFALRALTDRPESQAFVRAASQRVERALARWNELTHDPKRLVLSDDWSATSDDLLLWSSARRLDSIPVPAWPPPLPEGVLALEAVLPPNNAPHDVEDLEHLTWLLYAFGHFDAALAWASRGQITEPLLAAIRRMIDPETEVSSSPSFIQLKLHFPSPSAPPHPALIEVVTPPSGTDSSSDLEQRIEGAWREHVGALREPHILFAEACHHGAERLAAQRHYAESIRLGERALRNYTALLGPEHYSVGYMKAELVVPLAAVGRTEDALRHGREALVILRDTVGDAHPVTLGLVRVLAAQLLSHGDVEEAWTLTRDVLRSALRASAPTFAIGETLQALGTIELTRGRSRAAQRHLEHALQIAVAKAGPLSHPALVAHQHISVALSSQGKLAEAIEHMRQARAIAEHLHGPTSAQAIQARRNLARFDGVLLDLGHDPAAVAAEELRAIGADNAEIMRGLVTR